MVRTISDYTSANQFPVYIPDLDIWALIPDLEMFRGMNKIVFTYNKTSPCEWELDDIIVLPAMVSVGGKVDLSEIKRASYYLNVDRLQTHG